MEHTHDQHHHAQSRACWPVAQPNRVVGAIGTALGWSDGATIVLAVVLGTAAKGTRWFTRIMARTLTIVKEPPRDAIGRSVFVG